MRYPKLECGFLPVDFPPFIPFAYGTLALSRAIATPPYTVAIYGTDVVAVFEGSDTLLGLFDFSAYAHPPSSRRETVSVGSASVTTAAGTQEA